VAEDVLDRLRIDTFELPSNAAKYVFDMGAARLCDL